MNKIIFLLLPVLIFSSCQTIWNTWDTWFTEEKPVIDLNNFFAQVCESWDWPCKVMQCNLNEEIYSCAESISWIWKNCSSVKKFDDVISSYKICWEENSEDLKIFNFSQKLDENFSKFTPNELSSKITDELKVVEDWGSSDFLTNLMTSAWWALIWGLIANKLFWSSNAMPPLMDKWSISEPLNKDSLNKAKAENKTTQSNLKNNISSSKETIKKNIAAKKAYKKKKASMKKKTSKRRSSHRRGRRR